MKKISRVFLTLALPVIAVFFTLASCAALPDLEKVSRSLTDYRVQITYDSAQNTVAGDMKVNYFNPYEVPLSTLSFHLYANAYREGASIKPVKLLDQNKTYPDGMSYGHIDIEGVNAVKAGDIKGYEVGGTDSDILDITLSEKLFPGERLEFTIKFVITLPRACHRLGYSDKTINLGNFLPIASVYESPDGFFNNPYYSSGDPFYSHCANYYVDFTVPNQYKAAFTGDILNTSEKGANTVYSVKALAVRDFAAVLSQGFNIVTAVTQQGTTVNYYYYDDAQYEQSLSTAVRSMETFCELFGNYPYKQFSVVQARFAIAGMEYPQIVFISGQQGYESYTETIIHEAAHQWWYAVVGNNQISHPWLDEGLASYSTVLFYEHNPKYNITRESLILASRKSYRTFVDVYSQITGQKDTSMTRALNEYRSDYEYQAIAYIKAELMFDALRSSLGKDKFLKGLKAYYKDNAFNVATPQHLITAMEKSSRIRLESFFASWLDGKAIV